MGLVSQRVAVFLLERNPDGNRSEVRAGLEHPHKPLVRRTRVDEN